MAALTRDYSEGFFDDPATRSLIERISSADKITIYVGAGGSLDQGFPSWSRLVRDMLTPHLLSEAATVVDEPTRARLDNLVARTAARASRDFGETYVASVIDEIIARSTDENFDPVDRRNQELASLLYRAAPLGVSDRPSYIGRFLLLLCIILKRRGIDIQLATTNFDDALEHLAHNDPELIRELADNGITVVSEVNPSSSNNPHVLSVVHLHGSITRRGDASSVVFSERDYANEGTRQKIATFLNSRLSDGGLMLTIGASLRDDDLVLALLDYAVRDGSGRSNVSAVLPVDEELVDTSAVNANMLRFDQRDLPILRGSQLTVDVYRPDFRGQVYQLLIELAYTAADSTHVPYSTRLRTWWDAWSLNKYGVEEARRSVTEELEQLVLRHRGALGGTVADLKFEIWSRTEPDRRRFELWCSSQSMWLRRSAHRPHLAPIAANSQFAAVASFARRQSIDANISSGKEGREGRWTHSLATPITLDNAPYLSLPVGAVVAVFNIPNRRGEHLLSNSTIGEIRQLNNEMFNLGARALLP